MALPILDGNQSATTLSTVLSGGEHTPAHTVVSLGSTAISNITSAISGSVVSISNFPATQTIAGTVTVGNTVTISGTVTANPTGTQTIAGTVTANLANVVGYIADPNPTHGIALGYLGVDNEFQLVGNNGGIPISIQEIGSPQSRVGVTTAGVPVIGTVTANVPITTIGDGIGSYVSDYGNFPISGTVTVGNSVTVAGTVTAGLTALGVNTPNPITNLKCQSSGALLVDAIAGPNSSVLGYDGSAFVQVKQVAGSSVTIGSVPNGSLTTRFGTPTTANTAFATSAVTNASRKYLLIQNVTTGSNVITVGIGFAPTTTQGIQLTAGAGITFESSYIPTGAVYVLSSVTASNFTVLEA